MTLKCDNFTVTVDGQNGTLSEISFCEDTYKMNWIRTDCHDFSVVGYCHLNTEQSADKITSTGYNSDGSLSVQINRYVKNGKYCEDYVFENISDRVLYLNEDNTGFIFPYNCLFDKKENMLHKRCNSHIFCAEDVCNIQSVKLDGAPPYLIQRATFGAFSGYGLLCDIAITPNASYDRGSIVLYPKEKALLPHQKEKFSFEFHFSDKREELSFVSADKYSGFLNEEFQINVNAESEIKEISAECNGASIPFATDGKNARASISFDTLGEKKICVSVNGKNTFIKLNVLRSLEDIIETRTNFIAKKQQVKENGNPLDGAYLIYDRESDTQYCNRGFRDHNSARERLSMGALMALSLRLCYDEEKERSLRKHREFIEREILDIDSGFVNEGVNDPNLRLYNFPWVSTYYLEWYNFSGEIECLLIAAKVLHKYYELGGAKQESPCIEAYEILNGLEKEGLTFEYEKLKSEFLFHADSILKRRTTSSSHEVSCANGMMNLMSTFLFQAYLLTGEEKYLSTTDELLKISESFYDLQPDYKMYGIALRYWDMFWFGKYKAYGDTYPQWLSALTAQMYYYCDLATGTDHKRLIRDNLLGNCCVNFADGFAACGYLYPKNVKVFSSDPNVENPCRPLGEYKGERFDDFANDQDWSLYYAVKYLYGKNK